jgi:hypothetical protein
MRVIPLEKVILNSNIPTEDYSLSTRRVDKLLQEQNLFKSQVTVDRWLDLFTYTEYTGPAISAKYSWSNSIV